MVQQMEDSTPAAALELQNLDTEFLNGCPGSEPQSNLPLTTDTDSLDDTPDKIDVRAAENFGPTFMYKLFLVVLIVVLMVLVVVIVCVVWPEGAEGVAEGPLQSSIKGRQSYMRLPKTLLPEFYDLTLEVKMPSGNGSSGNGSSHLKFNGSVVITMLAKQTSVINLNAHKSVKVLEHLLVNEENEVVISSFEYDAARDMITINTVRTLQTSKYYNLTLLFEGYPSEVELEGLYAGSYWESREPSADLDPGKGNLNSEEQSESENELIWYAVTQMEPAAARKVFPCFDEPSFKSVFKITVIHESQFNALSNMPEERKTSIKHKPGWVQVEFEPSVKMSTYLVALAISTFKSKKTEVKNINNETIPIQVWAQNSEIDRADYGLDVASKAYVFFENYYQIPYTLPKMDLVSVPNFNAGGMENWGLITFRPVYLISQDSIQSRYGICKVVIHEVVHQWFGNLVTPVWWNDIWLNEGFATFMEYEGMVQIEKEWDVWSLFFVDGAMEVLAVDSLLSSHPTVDQKIIKNTDDLKMFFDLISYRKGASTLRMLKAIMGDDGFKTGILFFLNKFQFSSASSGDLWKSFEQLRNTTEVKYPITEMMEEWTMQLGYPLVTISVEYEADRYRIFMYQVQFLTNKNLSQSVAQVNGVWWHLKVEFESSKGTQDSTWLLKEPHNYVIEEQSPENDAISMKEKFLLANSRCEHFYRVNYDNGSWSRIISALKKNASALDSTVKACLIDNAWSLLAADLLPAEVPLNLTVIALKNDTSYPLWKTVKYHLERVYSLMYPTEDRWKFQQYCWKIADLAINTTNPYGRGDFDVLREENLLEFANFVEHRETVQKSVAKVVKWMKNPDKETVPKDGEMCAAVRNQNVSVTFDLYNLFKNIKSKVRNNILKGFGCTNDVNLYLRFLNDAEEDSWKVEELGYYIVAGAGRGINAGYGVVWNLFTIPQKFDNVGPKFKDFTFFFKNILFAVYGDRSAEFEVAEMLKFNETHYDKMGAGQASFYRLIERAQNNVQWVKYARPQISQWLNTVLPKIEF